MGTDLRCTVTLADGTEIAVRVPPPFPGHVQPGAEVSLYADASALRPLASEGAV
jgi:spermidine/putrescine transport system ATP-binding protein